MSNEFEDKVTQNLMLPGEHDNLNNLMPAHCAFQKRMAHKYFPKDAFFVNIGCKEDPAGLGEWKHCTNMDVQSYDHATKQDLTKVVKNFVQGDYLNEPHGGDWHDGVVLGEVLEHCTLEIGEKFLKKMNHETKMGGKLILTLPQDHREKYEQYAREEEYLEYAPGITSWHQTVWTKELLDQYLEDAGWNIIEYQTAWWFKSRGIFWHLIVAEKVPQGTEGSPE